MGELPRGCYPVDHQQPQLRVGRRDPRDRRPKEYQFSTSDGGCRCRRWSGTSAATSRPRSIESIVALKPIIPTARTKRRRSAAVPRSRICYELALAAIGTDGLNVRRASRTTTPIHKGRQSRAYEQDISRRSIAIQSTTVQSRCGDPERALPRCKWPINSSRMKPDGSSRSPTQRPRRCASLPPVRARAGRARPPRRNDVVRRTPPSAPAAFVEQRHDADPVLALRRLERQPGQLANQLDSAPLTRPTC